jgi:alpha-tubulin suppressor-like RCC1 family protein
VKIEIEGIIEISAGGHHSLLLNKNNKVYSFGINTFGQLGLNHTISMGFPTLINISDIIQISGGGIFYYSKRISFITIE